MKQLINPKECEICGDDQGLPTLYALEMSLEDRDIEIDKWLCGKCMKKANKSNEQFINLHKLV